MEYSITEIACAVGVGVAALGITVERSASFVRQRKWTNGGHPTEHLARAMDANAAATQALTKTIDHHEERSERRDDRHEDRDERRHEVVLGALMAISDRD